MHQKLIPFFSTLLLPFSALAVDYTIFSPFKGSEESFLKEQRDKQKCLDSSILKYPEGDVALILYPGGFGEVHVSLAVFVRPKDSDYWDFTLFWDQGWPYLDLPRNAGENIEIRCKNNDAVFSIKAKRLFDNVGGFEDKDRNNYIREQLLRDKARQNK